MVLSWPWPWPVHWLPIKQHGNRQNHLLLTHGADESSIILSRGLDKRENGQDDSAEAAWDCSLPAMIGSVKRPGAQSPIAGADPTRASLSLSKARRPKSAPYYRTTSREDSTKPAIGPGQYSLAVSFSGHRHRAHRQWHVCDTHVYNYKPQHAQRCVKKWRAGKLLT
jgi:hypothetical protein